MARIVVLGIKGDNGLWAADLDAGTVTQIGVPASGSLKTVDDLRKAGATITIDVNFAALAPADVTLTELSNGIYDK